MKKLNNLKLEEAKTMLSYAHMIEKVGEKEFDWIVVEKADYSRASNGNNGNYDEIAVYFSGKFVTTMHVSDYTYHSKQFVSINEQTTYEIVENRLILTEFGKSRDITELVENGKYMPFVRGAEYLVQEFQEMYEEGK